MDSEFKAANRAFSGNLRKQKDEGHNTSKSHRPIEEGHMKQIYDDYFIPHWNKDPVCLQHKVYFDIVYFLGKRGVEGLRELKKEGFEIKLNHEDCEYLILKHNETTKRCQVR